MPLHALIRLALALCLCCMGMAGAQAQVTAAPRTLVLDFNRWANVPFAATDTTPGGPHAATYAIASPPAHGSLDVPPHLRNAPTALMKQLGHGKGYQYDHDVEGGVALEQQGFPDALQGREYYQPREAGLELKLKDKLDRLRSARRLAGRPAPG